MSAGRYLAAAVSGNGRRHLAATHNYERVAQNHER